MRFRVAVPLATCLALTSAGHARSPIPASTPGDRAAVHEHVEASADAARPDPARAAANDNRTAAGVLRAGVLEVALEVVEARWYPEGEDGRSEVVRAFAQAGRAPQIPGPLIRVAAGATVHATIRNTLESPLVLYGLHPRPGSRTDTLHVAPGAVRQVRFAAGEPGTYFYWGTSAGASLEERSARDSQLHGAFVVDPAGTPAAAGDRVFVMGVWIDPADTTGPAPHVPREMMVINGKSWPYTERVEYDLGDTVRWRWVSPTTPAHPMHLHGFYYTVGSRGDWAADTVYAPEERRLVVTELMMPGGTMALEFVPTTAGNWLFHCHFGFHVSHFLSLDKVPEPDDPGAPDPHLHHMRGLALGVVVRDAAGRPDPPPPARARELRMHAVEGPGSYGPTSYAVLLQGADEPEPEADPLPPTGTTLVLRRGEPVRITILNHLRSPTAVHWHGLELERSWPDGVPGWSGRDGRVAGSIPPGGSFVAEFTPPRAGTFIYHSHSNEQYQISSGFYGALIVEDPDRPYDPETDRLVVIGADGYPAPGKEPAGRVNGAREPPAIAMEVGRTYRIRVVNIDPDWRVYTSLRSGGSLLEWRAVAKDGAELPPAQARSGPARILMGTGETADFEFTPTAPGDLRVDVETQLEGWTVTVPIRVRPSRAPGSR